MTATIVKPQSQQNTPAYRVRGAIKRMVKGSLCKRYYPQNNVPVCFHPMLENMKPTDNYFTVSCEVHVLDKTQATGEKFDAVLVVPCCSDTHYRRAIMAAGFNGIAQKVRLFTPSNDTEF